MLREPLLWIPDERLRNAYENNYDDNNEDDENDDELDQSINKVTSIHSSSNSNRICYDGRQVNEVSSSFSKNFIVFIKHPSCMLLFGACVGIVIPTANILFNAAVVSRYFGNENSDQENFASVISSLSSNQSVLLYLLFSLVTSTLAISLLLWSRKFIIKGYFEMKEEEKNLKLQQMQHKLQEQQLLYLNEDPSESQDDIDDVNDLDNIIFGLECRFIIGTLAGISIPFIMQDYYRYMILAAIKSPKLYIQIGIIAIGCPINICLRRRHCATQQVVQSYNKENSFFKLLEDDEDAHCDTEEDDEDKLDHANVHANHMMCNQLI